MSASYGIFRQRFTPPQPLPHMDLPGFKLHLLKGALKRFWAVTVRANWRVIFRFDGDAEDVDYVDYH